jgi:4-aminobutyrate aminotransferase/(S)-3-amino-2-methylpropionate transaminase
MEENNLCDRANAVSQYIFDRLRAMQRRFPVIGDVRGLGAMQAVEFVKNQDPLQPDADTCAALTKACLKRGLLLVSAGTHKNVIRFLAPLVITDAQLKWGMDVIEEELGERQRQ